MNFKFLKLKNFIFKAPYSITDSNDLREERTFSCIKLVLFSTSLFTFERCTFFNLHTLNSSLYSFVYSSENYNVCTTLKPNAQCKG